MELFTLIMCCVASFFVGILVILLVFYISIVIKEKREKRKAKEKEKKIKIKNAVLAEIEELKNNASDKEERKLYEHWLTTLESDETFPY